MARRRIRRALLSVAVSRAHSRGNRPRIDSLHDLVPPGSRVADIGTDRALLPRRLLADQRASHCIATELDEPRVLRARRSTIDLLYDPRLVIRAGDGLAALRASDCIDVVVIAGLGGACVAAILARGRLAELGIRRLVLQPRTDLGVVRSWLATHGFRIVDERLVGERGRLCAIIAAEAGPLEDGGTGCALLTPEDLFEVGPLLALSGDPQVRTYWRRELARLDGILVAAGEGEGRGRREAIRRRDLARRVLAALDASKQSR